MVLGGYRRLWGRGKWFEVVLEWFWSGLSLSFWVLHPPAPVLDIFCQILELNVAPPVTKSPHLFVRGCVSFCVCARVCFISRLNNTICFRFWMQPLSGLQSSRAATSCLGKPFNASPNIRLGFGWIVLSTEGHLVRTVFLLSPPSRNDAPFGTSPL